MIASAMGEAFVSARRKGTSSHRSGTQRVRRRRSGSAYTSRARENVQVGEDLFTTEVPGLQLALARPAVTITLELRRLNGTTLHCELPFPDEVSALVLKSLATTVRSKNTDITDICDALR